jgi:hypothetical protein
MTNDDSGPLSARYRDALRALLRYAIVMAIVGLLVGVAYQESAKKLSLETTGAGLHLEAVIGLALVHGHIFTIGVLLPLALAGALLMARRAGGREVGQRSLHWLVRGYLPAAAVTLVLQLVKGYHVLLAVRGGQTDLAAHRPRVPGRAGSAALCAVRGEPYGDGGLSGGVLGGFVAEFAAGVSRLRRRKSRTIKSHPKF